MPSMYDQLSPEERTLVLNNASKRLSPGKNVDRQTVEQLLMNNDQALAQAMQYAGVGNVPPNLQEDPGRRVFDINSVIDASAGLDVPVPDARPRSDGSTTSTPSTGQGNVSVPAQKPSVDEPVEPASGDNDVDDTSASNPYGTVAGVAGGITGIYVMKKIYDKMKANAATPEEVQSFNQAVQQGLDVRELEALPPPPEQLQITDQRVNRGGDVGGIPEIGGPGGNPQLPPPQRQLPAPAPIQSKSGARTIPASGSDSALYQAFQGNAPQAAEPNFQIPQVDIGMSPVEGVNPQQEGQLMEMLRGRVRVPAPRVRVP